MLRGAASRVGPLALRLREGACYFQEGTHLKQGGGSVNDTTAVPVPCSVNKPLEIKLYRNVNDVTIPTCVGFFVQLLLMNPCCCNLCPIK